MRRTLLSSRVMECRRREGRRCKGKVKKKKRVKKQK